MGAVTRIGDHEVLGPHDLVRGQVELHGEGTVCAGVGGMHRLAADRDRQLPVTNPLARSVAQDPRGVDLACHVRLDGSLDLGRDWVRPGLSAWTEQDRQDGQEKTHGQSARPHDR